MKDHSKSTIAAGRSLKSKAKEIQKSVTSAAVILCAQIFAEHEGAECAVQNEDSFGEQLLEELDPVRIGGHCGMPDLMRAVTS